MIEVLESLLGKRYDKIYYHCWTFVEEFYTKLNIKVPNIKHLVHILTRDGDFSKFTRLYFREVPKYDGCMVLIGDKHIGIYYKDYIFHNDAPGVQAEREGVLKIKYSKKIIYGEYNEIP